MTVAHVAKANRSSCDDAPLCETRKNREWSRRLVQMLARVTAAFTEPRRTIFNFKLRRLRGFGATHCSSRIRQYGISSIPEYSCPFHSPETKTNGSPDASCLIRQPFPIVVLAFRHDRRRWKLPASENQTVTSDANGRRPLTSLPREGHIQVAPQ